MLFVNPMWDSESQRIGKQKCTPLGYRLHVIADFIEFVGFLLLLATGAYLANRVIVGTFHASLLWLLSVPFSLDFVGTALFQVSWALAKRKGFHYDAHTREASWMEGGERHTYKPEE